jgi:hypothetical protein
MAPDEYSKALNKALSDLQQGIQQRDLLNATIAGLRETVRHLSTLVQMPTDKRKEVAKLLAMADYATPSLTDAIRSLLLQVSPKELTAIEVRDALDDSSNSEDFSNSLSACHAALKRMLSDGEIEAGQPKNGKATYRRVPPEPLTNLSSLLGILSGRIPGVPPGLPVSARLPVGLSEHPTEHTKKKTIGQLIGEGATSDDSTTIPSTPAEAKKRFGK